MSSAALDTVTEPPRSLDARRAWAGFSNGLSVIDIAEQMKISRGEVIALLDESEPSAEEATRAFRVRRILAQLEMLNRQLHGSFTDKLLETREPDTKLVDRIHATIDRITKLGGLNAPTVTQIEQEITVVDVRSIIADYQAGFRLDLGTLGEDDGGGPAALPDVIDIESARIIPRRGAAGHGGSPPPGLPGAPGPVG